MIESLTARSTLLDQAFPGSIEVSHVEVRRTSIAVGTTGGVHVHGGPVFGSIEQGQPPSNPVVRRRSLSGRVDEPADVVLLKFDMTTDDVVFLGYRDHCPR